MAPDGPSDVYPIEAPGPRAVGVPRRFGVGVLLILVTFFAVLFAFLSSFDYGPKVFAVVGVLFVGVAAGQSLLFGGEKPREASIVVGIILFPLELLGLAVYEQMTGQFGRGSIVENVVPGLLCSVVPGALFGYLAGCLTAGVFFVMDRLRKTHPKDSRSAIELQPFSEADVDTLLAWIDSPRMLQLWAGAAFSAPLDRPQLERHLRRASGEEPDRLIFKALSKETGCTVGHVELCSIDRRLLSATVGLALVGPQESQRGELSIALLQAILAVAFGQMGLHRVDAAVPVHDRQAIACYKTLGFISEGVRRDSLRLSGRYADQQIMSMLRHEWLWQQRSRRAAVQTHAFPES